MQLEIPLIGILRGIGGDVFGPLMQASFSAGLQAIEVTMNTPGAEEIIAGSRDNVPAGKYLGMGTVRNITEAERAYDAGASMVKVFPCRALGGPQYIRELHGPFDYIPLVAVGGVTIENVSEYLQAGAKAAGVGISLFGAQAVAAEDWKAVGKNVERFIQRCTVV